MTTIVRAGSDFIDEQLTIAQHEKLYTQYTFVFEAAGDRQRGFCCTCRHGDCLQVNGRHSQNALLVDVARDWKNRTLTIQATRQDNRELFFEIEHGFKHARHTTKLSKRLQRLLKRAHARLAFAVITETSDF